MRRRRKQNACLNCGYPLDSEIYNYCPSCGQENTSTNISFGQLLYDFFNNAFSFDSRLGNSIVPFFFKPGYLTRQFNEGKRASYVNPVRLYLIISLFYFFALSLTGKKIAREMDINQNEPDSTEVVMGNVAAPGNSFLKAVDSLHVMDTLRAELAREQAQLTGKDSIRSGRNRRAKDAISVSLDDAGDGDGSFLGIDRKKWATYNRLKDNRRVSDDALYDSLTLETNSTTVKFLVRQIIRVNRADKQTLVDFVTKNLPVLMFIMLPVFALILKLLYVRRKVLYVQHLMHAIHLHCFAYIVYGVGLLALLWLEGDTANDWIVLIAFMLATVYAYRSFRRVYQQGWFKTLVKFVALGWIYSWCLFAGVMFEMIVSFLLF